MEGLDIEVEDHVLVRQEEVADDAVADDDPLHERLLSLTRLRRGGEGVDLAPAVGLLEGEGEAGARGALREFNGPREGLPVGRAGLIDERESLENCARSVERFDLEAGGEAVVR